MRFFPLTLALALCSMLFSGCARMNIRVDILNSAYWSAPEYIESVTLARIVETEQEIRDGRFIQRREILKQRLASTLKSMEDRKLATNTAALAKGAEVPIDARFESARNSFEAAFAGIRDAALLSSAADRANKINAAKRQYTAGAEALAVLETDLAKDLRGPLTASQVGELQQVVRQATQGLIGDAGILDDPRAAAAIYAPNPYWSGVFNQTACFGSGGNSDCAVKMEGLGTFTLKGVRLDATKITQATFSVAKEAIQTVAALYGVPVPKAPASASSGGDGGAAAQPELQSPARRQRDAETSIAQLRLARLAMYETIMAQRQAVQGTDAARAQAIKTIKASLEANRKQLEPGSTP